MALRVGLTAGLAFLAVNLGMEALGWQVGGPGAAERATMLTVTSSTSANSSPGRTPPRNSLPIDTPAVAP